MLLDSSSERFYIQDNQLLLKDASLIDYESQKEHSIQVLAVDSYGLSVSENFVIQ